MSQVPVTKNFGKSPSDVVGQLKLKGGVAEEVAEGLFRFEVAVEVKNGRRRLIEVSLVPQPVPPSVSAPQWKKSNEGEAKRFETYRDFINKAKEICRDELEDDGMNALDLILAKLQLFEEFVRFHGDKAGIPRLSIDGFVNAAATTWNLGPGQVADLRSSLVEVIKDRIREELEEEGETS